MDFQWTSAKIILSFICIQFIFATQHNKMLTLSITVLFLPSSHHPLVYGFTSLPQAWRLHSPPAVVISDVDKQQSRNFNTLPRRRKLARSALFMGNQYDDDSFWYDMTKNPFEPRSIVFDATSIRCRRRRQARRGEAMAAVPSAEIATSPCGGLRQEAGGRWVRFCRDASGGGRGWFGFYEGGESSCCCCLVLAAVFLVFVWEV